LFSASFLDLFYFIFQIGHFRSQNLPSIRKPKNECRKQLEDARNNNLHFEPKTIKSVEEYEGFDFGCYQWTADLRIQEFYNKERDKKTREISVR